MSRTLELSGKSYVVDKLPLRKAMNIHRRVQWAFLELAEEHALHQNVAKAVIVFSKAMSKLSDADYDQYYFGLLSAVKRKENGNALVNIVDAESLDLRYQDISQSDLDELHRASMEENFNDFFQSAQQNSPDQSLTPSAP